MGVRLFDLLKNIFENHNSTSENYTLIRIYDTLHLQHKSMYNKEFQCKIEKNINEFKKQLKKSNTSKFIFDTFQVSDISLYDFNIDDILGRYKSIFSTSSDVLVTKGVKDLAEEKSVIKELIYIKKYNLYMEDIKKLLADLLCIIIALKELDFEHKVAWYNRRTFEHIINDFATCSIICKNLREAIKLDTNSCKSLINNTKLEETDIDALKNYYNNLLEQASKILPENEIKNIGGNVYDKIAGIEKKCEEYLHTHPEFKEKINLKLQDIENSYSTGNTENLINEINELEKELIFYEQHGNTLDSLNIKEIKEKLYKLKFYITAYNYNLNESNLLESEDQIARDIYEREVEKRLNDLFRGKNTIIKECIGEESIKEALKILRKVFTGGCGYFDTNLILGDIYNLQLLVSLDNKEALKRWFKKKVERECFIGRDDNERYFENEQDISFSSEVPIETICHKFLISEDIANKYPLVEFYRMFKEAGFFDDKLVDYYVPDGIETININIGDSKNPDIESKSSRFLQVIEDNIKTNNYGVVFPESIKKVHIKNYDVHDEDSIKEKETKNKQMWFCFKYGVEEIKYDGFFETMIIPASVRKLDLILDSSKFFSYNVGRSYRYGEINPNYKRFKSNNGSLFKIKDIMNYEIKELNKRRKMTLIFKDYKKSALFKENTDWIKSLSKECEYEIILQDEFNKRSFTIPSDVEYEVPIHEHTKQGRHFGEKRIESFISIFRRPGCNSKNREEAENALRFLLSIIQNNLKGRDNEK